MTQTSKTFRIFVSSTFSDLHAERNALQKFVFPRLRELCLQHGCRFQAIDLRWGVSAEAGRDQKTMRICLDEIRRCQIVTPRPNFIVLLGDRYGWCPLPEEIPADEFEEIKNRINDEDRTILVWEENQPENQKGWYRLDENAAPNVYCLQPRGAKFAEYADWEKVEQKLRAILQNTVENFEEEARAKYVASATEQEINQGLADENSAEHVFCFFRSFSNRNEINPEKARDFFELDENKKPDEIANQKLENLKKRLRDDLPKENVHDYKAKWLNDKSSLTTDHIGDLPDDLEECKKRIDDENAPKSLCLDVWRQLARVILAEISEIESLSAVEKEKENHEKFGADRAKHFVGRTDYLDKIREYIESDNQKPFVLWGASGSGKSALMAYAAQEHKGKTPLVRFIGATPKSSDIRSLLESLCQQISAALPTDEMPIPADYNELVKEFPTRLARATRKKPLVVMLDALDQLSDADNAQNLRWLPEDLPENVHLIVSTLPGESLKILERKLPAENIIQLKPMPKDEGDKVLDLWLSDAKRTLQEHQRAEILKKFSANGLPLYLKFAFEEARLWHSYDKLKPLPETVEDIIGSLFERLSEESEHGKVLVSRSLGYLAASRYGLTEDELLDVLSEDEEVFTDFINRSPTERAKEETKRLKQLPVVIWSRLYFDLEPYLTERASADTALLSFYHRQLGEVTAQKYLSGDDKQRAHKHLADYFDGQNYWHETPQQYRNRVGEFPKSARRANQRKASELAFQLRQSDDYKSLEQIHTNLDFLESKTAAGLVFELAKDFTEALKIIPLEHPLRHIIRLLEEAIRRDIYFIAPHYEDYPQALFQCLWNSGWWYDCPQAANHYEEKDGPWSKDEEKLYRLLEKWRDKKETESSGFRWMMLLRPPALHLGSALITIIRLPEFRLNNVAISSDGRYVSASNETHLGAREVIERIWDIETGKEIKHTKGQELNLASSKSSSDWQWSVKRGFHEIEVSRFSKEAKKLKSKEVKTLKHTNGIKSIAISADGRRIVSGCYDDTIWIWDNAIDPEYLPLKDHKYEIEHLTILEYWERIVTVSRGTLGRQVLNWDMETGEELTRIGDTYEDQKQAESAYVPRRATFRDQETVIESQGDAVAWIAGSLSKFATYSDGRTWASAEGNHLVIMRIEGIGNAEIKKDELTRRKMEYQQALSKWQSLRGWRLLFAKKPKPPEGIEE